MRKFLFLSLFLNVLLSYSYSLLAAPAPSRLSKLSTVENPAKKLHPAEVAIIRQQQTLELPVAIETILTKQGIPREHLSIFIKDIHADAPMILHHADVPRNPASTMKLVTTYAALNLLGPTWTWKTEAYLRGKLKEGTLDGDLLIKGYGDPFLVYENFWKFLRALRDKGLKTINGNLIIDNSFFKLAYIDPAAFDNRPYRVYNAPPSALMYNFQATRFHIKPKKSTGSIDLSAEPPIVGFRLNNQLKFTKGRCFRGHYRPKLMVDEINKQVTLSGRYSNRCGKHVFLAVVTKANQHAFNAFHYFWQTMEGTLKGKIQFDTVKNSDTLFHQYHSETLTEQIRLINKWSNNVMTRQLLLTMGAKQYDAPATLKKGRKAIHDLLTQKTIDTSQMKIDNGSGLSRDGRVSARQLGEILLSAYRDPFMPEFMSSLPLSGLDGTLAKRFRHEDLKGRIHMKTGSLNQVTAIAGYMLNRQGKRLVIVCLHNGNKVGGGRGKLVQNALLRWAFEQ